MLLQPHPLRCGSVASRGEMRKNSGSNVVALETKVVDRESVSTRPVEQLAKCPTLDRWGTVRVPSRCSESRSIVGGSTPPRPDGQPDVMTTGRYRRSALTIRPRRRGSLVIGVTTIKVRQREAYSQLVNISRLMRWSRLPPTAWMLARMRRRVDMNTLRAR